jgi:hypothetical protein
MLYSRTQIIITTVLSRKLELLMCVIVIWLNYKCVRSWYRVNSTKGRGLRETKTLIYSVPIFFVFPLQNYNGKKRLFCKFSWRTSLDMYVILQTGITLFNILVPICNCTKTPFDFELRKFWTSAKWVYSVSNNATFLVIGPGHGLCYKINRTSQIIIGWISLCHGHYHGCLIY